MAATTAARNIELILEGGSRAPDERGRRRIVLAKPGGPAHASQLGREPANDPLVAATTAARNIELILGGGRERSMSETAVGSYSPSTGGPAHAPQLGREPANDPLVAATTAARNIELLLERGSRAPDERGRRRIVLAKPGGPAHASQLGREPANDPLMAATTAARNIELLLERGSRAPDERDRRRIVFTKYGRTGSRAPAGT
ncbi:MAG TPA: hypothetical protein VGD37_36740 [Kofleriaceae bacterium]